MWFGNLPMSTELQKFHYSQKKIQDEVVQFFFFLKKTRQNSLISKITIFSILCIGFTMGYKTGQKIFSMD